jgi:hypothetical protein
MFNMVSKRYVRFGIRKYNARNTKKRSRTITVYANIITIAQELTKKVFIVKYVSIGGDAQETSTIAKQVPEFVNATFCTFNHETREWEVHQLKK